MFEPAVMLICWGAGLLLGLLVLAFVAAAGKLPANEGKAETNELTLPWGEVVSLPGFTQEEIDAMPWSSVLPYDETECVMCGKEGAVKRDDGKCYCASCWQVWNS
jgi:hypothetical protein